MLYGYEYNYDEVGNRLSLVYNGQATYYSYNAANELTAEETPGVETVYYTYDGRGNQVERKVLGGDTLYFDYNSRNLITRIDSTEPGFVPNTFGYNALGQRIRKTDSAGTTYYVWDGLNITHEHDGSGTVTRRYTHGHTPIHGVFSLISVQDELGCPCFYHLDQVGGVRRLTDRWQNAIKAYEFSPFGTMLQEAGNAPSAFVFPAGSVALPDIEGLRLSATRVAAVRTGRYTSTDPVVLFPYYAILLGNPLRFVDPSGRTIEAGGEVLFELGILPAKVPEREKERTRAAAEAVANVGMGALAGVVSVPVDIALGLKRTGEGFGALWGSKRSIRIWEESERLARVLYRTVRLIASDVGPIAVMVAEILREYQIFMPSCAIEYLVTKGFFYRFLGKMAGRFVVGKGVAKAIARAIAAKVAGTTLYKQIAAKIGVSTGSASTGIGMPISLLLMQGVAERASWGSRELQQISPTLYSKLKENDLDMLYFLVADYLNPIVGEIERARNDPQGFFLEMLLRYCECIGGRWVPRRDTVADEPAQRQVPETTRTRAAPAIAPYVIEPEKPWAIPIP